MTEHPPTPEQDPLEHRLQDWAAAGLRAAPAVSLPVVRRERRWAASLAVAAAVAALVMVVAVVTSRDQAPIAAPLPATPARSASFDAGSVEPLQQVVFQGLLVEVPASWKLDAADCGVALQNTVIRQQVAPACYRPTDPDLTVVQFWQNSHGGPNGDQVPYSLPGDRDVEARRYDKSEPATETTTIVVPELATSVTITSPDREKVDAILATLRLVEPTDQLAVPTNPAALTDQGPESALPSAEGPTEAATTTADSPALQDVAFKGVQVSVSASWALDAVQCSEPRQNTVIRLQVFLACAMSRPAGVTDVQFLEGVVGPSGGPAIASVPFQVPGDRPADALRYDERILGEEPLEVTTVVIPSLAVSVIISSPDRTEVDTILATLRQVAVDGNGCATIAPGEELSLGPATLALPVGATSTVLCRYFDETLRNSVSLTAAETEELGALIEGLPVPEVVEPAACPESRPWVQGNNSVLIQVDGRTLTVVLHDCLLFVSDGSNAAGVSPGLFQFLVNKVGLDSGFSPLLTESDPSPTG